MGDVILAAMVMAAVTLAGLVLYFNNREEDENQPEKLDGKGDWFITERNAGFNATAVCLVRRYKDRDTNVITVARIPDGAANWTTLYEEAMAAARERLASLQGN